MGVFSTDIVVVDALELLLVLSDLPEVSGLTSTLLSCFSGSSDMSGSLVPDEADEPSTFEFARKE